MSVFPVVGVARPNFLILTPICLSLGLASALLTGIPIDWTRFAVILVGGLMAHVSVNALNEYADFQSGLDFKTDKTPFSGGSGTLVMQPRLAIQALMLGVLSLLTTILSGLYLVQQTGWGLTPIGLAGVAIIVLYTGWVNRNRYLVLITPGLGFGPLMVIGTHYALTGTYQGLAWLLSLIPFFLVNNLLLLNQIPDREADQSVGRDNFAIAWGTVGTAQLFLGFALLAYASIILGVLGGMLPGLALLGLLTLPLSYQVFVGVRESNGDLPQLIPNLGKNVAITLATPLLVSVGIFLSAYL
ncbi:MAG: prenyltransferase [Candidatus Thiodiazotropha sp.]